MCIWCRIERGYVKNKRVRCQKDTRGACRNSHKDVLTRENWSMSEPEAVSSESETNQTPEEESNRMRSGEAQIRGRLERAHRRRVAVIVVPGVLGVALFLLLPYLLDLLFLPQDALDPQDKWHRQELFDQQAMLNQYKTVGWFLAVGLFLASGSGVVLMYLQTGFRTPARQALDDEHYYPGFGVVEDETRSEFRKEVLRRLSSLESTGQATAGGLSSEAANEIVGTVQRRIEEAAIGQYLDDVRSSLKKQEDVGLILRSGERLEDTIRRLREELYALRRRGNINLLFGIVVALVGMSLLGYFVLPSSIDGNQEADFIQQFLPRLSLVLVVEVFAYFFLRLYPGCCMSCPV